MATETKLQMATATEATDDYTATKLQIAAATKQRAIATTLLAVHVHRFDGIIDILWRMD